MSKILRDELINKRNQMILSVSGWRAVFATDETSENEDLSEVDSILVVGIAKVFYDYIIKQESGKVYLGRDSRPTGENILSIIASVWEFLGLPYKNLGCIAIPQLIAHHGSTPTGGFLYCSASHNPVGFNGVKMGFDADGVAESSIAKILIDNFVRLTDEFDSLFALYQQVKMNIAQVKISLKTSGLEENAESRKSYLKLVETVYYRESDKKDLVQTLIKNCNERDPYTVISEFNGSARILSLDTDVLNSLGYKSLRFNDKVGKFAHDILPEGENLLFSKELLEKLPLAQKKKSIAYVPDCDGDRGNIVYYSSEKNEAVILSAQKVFALSVLSEILFHLWLGCQDKLAVAVNGATSMLVDDLMSPLGVIVERAEVGEANIIQKAEELRSRGYRVPILGEGSNGGSINYPSLVRDPIHTVLGILKLLSIKDSKDKLGLVSLWFSQQHKNLPSQDDIDLDMILAAFPAYNTIELFRPICQVRNITSSHKNIKNNFERLFLDLWSQSLARELAKHGVHSYKVYQTEGISERIGMGESQRNGKMTGGYKISFYDVDESSLGYFWMRGSGTEPMWRVLFEWRGQEKEWHLKLLETLRDLLVKADRA